jgi:hypothetical protein
MTFAEYFNEICGYDFPSIENLIPTIENTIPTMETVFPFFDFTA